MQSVQMVSSQLSQYNLRCIPSWTLQRTGLDSAEGPRDFNSSIAISLWLQVVLSRLWAWLQKSQRKIPHKPHLTRAGSPETHFSQTMDESLVSVCLCRATSVIKLFKIKFTWRLSTAPFGTCRNTRLVK